MSPIPKKQKATLWRGPEEDGITFSLLSRFLVCRERFRLLVVEGLRPKEAFNHRIEFGSMWHICEESLAGTTGPGMVSPYRSEWETPLTDYARGLLQKYPAQADLIDYWYQVVKTMFPLYVDYWSKHPDVIDRTPLLQEQVFDVPYRLPSGLMVRLRGKWDAVDLIGRGKDAGVYLQENKTKSDIYEERMKRQLTFDLQTMLYLVALCHEYDHMGWAAHGPIAGVRYNVIRRPQHRQGKKESRREFCDRLQRVIEEDQAHFFMRWKVEILPEDVAKFRRECLDPILEQLCEWWEWVRKYHRDGSVFDLTEDDGNPWGIHWRHPFGVYNPLDEGGSSDLDEFLATGSELGLTRTENLFPELG